MPTAIYLTLIILIGLLGSAWSVTSLLKYSINPYGLKIGHWYGDPDSGSTNANPYQKVLTAISGALPLDTNEAVTFIRTVDEKNQPLRLECTYTLGSEIANARFWTLTMTRKDGTIIKPNWEGANALYSQDLIFDNDNSFSLTIGKNAHPDNWLPIAGGNAGNDKFQNGEFQLVLRMYDTPIVSNNAIFEIKLPEIHKIGCAS